MNILLDTGLVNNARSSVTSIGNTSIDNSPSERIVYPHRREQYVLVAPGTMAVITAYTETCKPIVVRKILLSNGIPATATGDGCCLALKEGAETTILNRVIIPAYRMDKDNPVRVISIPGVYSIAPEVDEMGDVVITAMEYPLQLNGPSLREMECECRPCGVVEL